MKTVYLLRHGEKDENGLLTATGQVQAKELGIYLPNFAIILSSGSNRAKMTGKLLTGKNPYTDERAGFSNMAQQNTKSIAQLAKTKGIAYFEALNTYDNGKVQKDITNRGQGLNQLINELLQKLAEGQNALVVSHNVTITPAMLLRGHPRQPIEYLGGYTINDQGTVNIFKYEKNRN